MSSIISRRITKIETLLDKIGLDKKYRCEVFACKEGFDPFLLYSYPNDTPLRIILSVDDSEINQWKRCVHGNNTQGYLYDVKKALEHFGESSNEG